MRSFLLVMMVFIFALAMAGCATIPDPAAQPSRVETQPAPDAAPDVCHMLFLNYTGKVVNVGIQLEPGGEWLVHKVSPLGKANEAEAEKLAAREKPEGYRFALPRQRFRMMIPEMGIDTISNGHLCPDPARILLYTEPPGQAS